MAQAKVKSLPPSVVWFSIRATRALFRGQRGRFDQLLRSRAIRLSRRDTYARPWIHRSELERFFASVRPAGVGATPPPEDSPHGR